MLHSLSRPGRRGTHALLPVMADSYYISAQDVGPYTTDYESESSGTLNIRRLRNEAADTTLSPSNVRRVVQSVRSPPGRTMATHSGREGGHSSPRAAEAAEALDEESTALLQNMGFTVLRPSGVGVGASPSTRPIPSTSGVGVGASPTARPTPSTSRIGRTTGVGSTARPPRRCGGKEPRRTPPPPLRTVRNMSPVSRQRMADRRLRRLTGTSTRTTSAAAGAGGDGGGGSSDDGSSDGSRRGRRRMQQDLGRLLDQLRQRADG